MNTKMKWLGIALVIGAGLVLALAVAQVTAGTTQASEGTTVTNIKVNGRSADTFLVDSGDPRVLGFANVSQDQIANTVSLEFSYVTYPFTDPDLVVLWQGAGEIPNTALTITDTSAHVTVTTPPSFQIIRCVLNTNTGDFTCALADDPISFDLVWVTDGIGSITEKTDRVETFGPVTTKFKGEYRSLTATVSGTWGDGHTAVDLAGNVLDSRNKTLIREVTLKATP